MLRCTARRCISPHHRMSFSSSFRTQGRQFIRRETPVEGFIGRRKFCSTVAPVVPSFRKLWCGRLYRGSIKVAGFHVGLLIGAACVVPEPFTVVQGLYRFVSCLLVTSVIAADYKYSLHGLEGDAYSNALHKVHERSAKRLLSLFQYNKGIFIKFGQHLAALDYLLPEEYTSTMHALHSAPQHLNSKVCSNKSTENLLVKCI